MYEDPNNDEEPAERVIDPKARAQQRSDEFRMHAELAAVFEGVRKFDAHLRPDLPADAARQVQRGMARLEKAKSLESPVVPAGSAEEALALLKLPLTLSLSTNDYHIYRRPGEVMIARWLAGDEIDPFYERLQAHFDAALEGFRDEERSNLAWKQDAGTLEYLAALDAIQLKMADRYLRDTLRQHKLFILSTQAADELNIAYLANQIMSVGAEELVGSASAPPETPTEQDLAWFFKLFSLRGMDHETERMCFFAYLQKSDDAW